MDFSLDALYLIWHQLVWPLLRLLFFIGVGLIAANLIESLNWTKKIAVISRPLITMGHFPERVGAAFSIALVSGVAANTMLAESYEKNLLSKKALILANLFNSLPTYFLHLPTVIVITVPLIKVAGLAYIAITFTAALLRTITIVVAGRIFLDKPVEPASVTVKNVSQPERMQVLKNIWKRFKKRMRKIAVFTVPIYTLIFIMNRLEFFTYLEQSISQFLVFFPWLSPQSLGIITLHMAAELTAGLAAAGALLQDGTMSSREVILALLVGNVLSSPLRAIRHQFPYYAGIFKPALATELIIYNQCFRIFSLIIIGIGYFLFTAA